MASFPESRDKHRLRSLYLFKTFIAGRHTYH